MFDENRAITVLRSSLAIEALGTSFRSRFPSTEFFSSSPFSSSSSSIFVPSSSSAFLSATQTSFFPFLNPSAHSKQLSGPSDSQPLQALSQSMPLKEPSGLTQNLFCPSHSFPTWHSSMSRHPCSVFILKPLLHAVQLLGPDPVQWPSQALWQGEQSSFVSSRKLS